MGDQEVDDVLPWPVEPIYYPDRSGDIRLFAGDVDVRVEGEIETVRGELRLRLEGRGAVEGQVAMWDPRRRTNSFVGADARIVGVHANSLLRPPLGGRLHGSTEQILPASIVVAGDLQNARQLLVHVCGELTTWLPAVDVEGGATQGRVDFDLLGWPASLVVAGRVGSDPDPASFSHVVHLALPSDHPAYEDVEARLSCLFPLLSFIAGQEVGATIVVGTDEANEPVWASWASPRRARGHPGVRWCPPQLVPDALPAIAQGLSQIWEDDVLREAVKRAIGYLGVAARGLREVQIPVACIALELLAWAVLQRESLVTAEALREMKAATMMRLLLRTSEIPPDLPAHFAALPKRLTAINQRDWSGPEILVTIRNRLVHPPSGSTSLNGPPTKS